MRKSVRAWAQDLFSDKRNYGKELEEHFFRFSAALPASHEVEDGSSIDVAQELAKLFKFHGVEIGDQTEFEFLEKTNSPRKLKANLSPKFLDFEILGCLPERQSPPSIQLFPAFKRKVGKITENDRIDFRDSNTFPIVRKGETVGIYLPYRSGEPGRDVYGRLVSLPPVEADRSADFSEDFEAISLSTGEMRLTALRDGVLKIDGQEPFCSLRIVEDLRVKKIDFRVGNIGDSEKNLESPISLTVDEDIRGIFKVLVKGDLNVRGVLEARQTIVGGQARVERMTGQLTAKRKAKVASALHSKVESEEVVLTREAVESSFRCRRFEASPETVGGEVYLANSIVSARKIKISDARVSQKLEIDLRDTEFKEVLSVKKKIQSMRRKQLDLSSKVKEGCVKMKEIVRESKSPILKSLLKKILLNLKEGALVLVSELEIETEYDLLFLKEAKKLIADAKEYFEVGEELSSFQKKLLAFRKLLSDLEVSLLGVLSPESEIRLISCKGIKTVRNSSDSEEYLKLRVTFQDDDLLVETHCETKSPLEVG